jgi:hypothetical protein
MLSTDGSHVLFCYFCPKIEFLFIDNNKGDLKINDGVIITERARNVSFKEIFKGLKPGFSDLL